jgi:hypothetical protein
MDSWVGTNRTRLDLKKRGEVVLVQRSGRWEPFKLIDFDVQNKRVFGEWILTDEEVKLSGNEPTYPINEEWTIMYINELMEERKKIGELIEVIKNLKFP